ncbi:MAG: DUF2309 domain-containing protein [Pseudomonadota bacterium]
MSQTETATKTAIEKIVGLNGWANAVSETTLVDIAFKAAGAVAPLWPLENFVASNPYWGFVGETFEDAGVRLTRTGYGDVMMSSRYYAEKIRSETLSNQEITQMGSAYGGGYEQLTVDELARELERTDSIKEAAIPTVAEVAAQQFGIDFPALITESISAWAASHFDEGQAIWPSPWKSLPAFTAWHAESSLDRQLEACGITSARSIIRDLPGDASALFHLAAEAVPMSEERLELYFPRLLSSISGWAGHARYLDWESTQHGSNAEKTAELLAIRLAWELLLLRAYPGLADAWSRAQSAINLEQSREERYARRLRLIAHRALEQHAQRTLIDDAFRNPGLPTSLPAPQTTPDMQAVFCIDVRSERLRRVLECEDPRLETRGFAGFFGLPIEVLTIDGADADAQCPVLLEPQYQVRETARTAEATEVLRAKTENKRQVGAAWRTFNRAAVSSFAYVESLGLAYAARLASDTVRGWFGFHRKREMAPSITPVDSCGEPHGLASAEKSALAESVLRGMSLTERFGELIALVGHGSSSVNNPYASRYHCGACGGHAGDANARLAASILNDDAVRIDLRAKGIDIPETTQFVAALHDTATDQVSLIDVELLPNPEAPSIARLQTLFDNAASTVRLARARDHGVMDESAAQILRRSNDWSEVRPEWGLVGCQAFIAAPRYRTRHVDLHGRSFLHEYDWKRDEGFKVLELIMTAPLVVASWISLQYFASTVDNRNLGSGDKTLHNVVSGIGVLEGTGGDLRVGLPWQSIHDGANYLHQPLRLSACIAAPAEAITGILMKHESVRELFDNQWLHLYALEDDGRIRQYLCDYRWKDTDNETVQSLHNLPQDLEREAV